MLLTRIDSKTEEMSPPKGLTDRAYPLIFSIVADDLPLRQRHASRGAAVLRRIIRRRRRQAFEPFGSADCSPPCRGQGSAVRDQNSSQESGPAAWTAAVATPPLPRPPPTKLATFLGSA